MIAFIWNCIIGKINLQLWRSTVACQKTEKRIRGHKSTEKGHQESSPSDGNNVNFDYINLSQLIGLHSLWIYTQMCVNYSSMKLTKKHNDFSNFKGIFECFLAYCHFIVVFFPVVSPESICLLAQSVTYLFEASNLPSRMYPMHSSNTTPTTHRPPLHPTRQWQLLISYKKRRWER